MKGISIRRISLVLLMSLIICLMAVLSTSAAEITVDIVSFMRGPQADLQSSELLEARLYGYDGNIHDLTYKWTNKIKTYLYVYNSHNMYNINNTEGEIEIYPSSKSGSSNMSGFTHKETFSGKGYAWAAVYGADVNSTDLVGTITVEVYDAKGTLLATDTHTGTRERTGSFFWGTYTNYGIVPASLSNDLDQVSFGMFEGDTRNVKDLLGEASIVHITCEECTVTTGKISSGSEYISLSGNVEDDYYITGVSKGSGTAEVTIQKGNCKFHKNTSATATTTAYVYRKPTTTSTATAIELDNLDPDCRYFIAGVEGTHGKDQNGKDIVIFEGLTPNTKYEIEVVGHTEGTLPVYAYVYETTKPAHTGTVEIILNGYYDAASGTAIGTRIDISEVIEGCEKPYVRYENSELYFALEKTSTGVYTSILSNGTYHIYYAPNADAKICDQLLTIDDANRTRELFFFTVEYDPAGGTFTPETLEYHHDTHDVSVSSTAPYKEGYIFTGWLDQYGTLYSAGELLTDSIDKPYELTAQYVEATDIYVNIKIHHVAEDGISHNNDRGMHDITFTVDQKTEGAHDFTEIFSKAIDWDGRAEFTDSAYNATHVSQNGDEYTLYTAEAPTVANVPKPLEYTFTTTKSGYQLVSVTSETDENGDLQIYAELVYDPSEVDFTFKVELDEESKALSDELKPAAVNVKVTMWYNTPHDEHYGLPEGDPTVDWFAVPQQHYTYERVPLDENGHGSDSFPVWPKTTDGYLYHYRIEVVSYELSDGTIVNTTDYKDAHEIYVCELERYVSTISVEGGKDPDTDDESTLTGAWFNDNGEQQGTVKATVKIHVFDVTFDPSGGVLNGSSELTTIKDQLIVPNLSAYVPTREGGYTFSGWHLIANIDGETVNSGDKLTRDVTLVASWIEPITIEGTVSASVLYYDENGEAFPILGDFKIAHAYLLLQKIDSTGYGITIDSMDIPLTYSDDIHGVGTYRFSGIPNDGTKYRVDILTASYEDRFQNELSSSTVVTDFDVYDEEHYTAELGDDDTAIVNVYMFFEPATFDLQYKIDTTAINDASRPSTVEMLVLYNDFQSGMNPQRWPVISQMIDGNHNVGQDTTLTNGVANNGFPVWSYEPDDSALFEYAIRVDGVDGADYEENPYYFVEYNGSARFDDISSMTENDPAVIDEEPDIVLEQTKLLVARFVPRRYTVTFELNAKEGDMIEGMDEYLTVYNTHETEYTWSYGTLINATPRKEGFKFLGWYDANGNKVEAISADMHENITLYAKWIPGATFNVMSDAGYYATEYGANEQVGVISFNAHISNLEIAKDYITSFGIYVYNAAGDVLKATASSVNADTLTEDGGYFHTVITNIDKSNFDVKVLAIPFVVLDADGNPETENDSEIVLGNAMLTAVSDINKWLGETNPYAE